MHNIISFTVDTIDYDAAVDEVDLLVPKYLEALDLLQNFREFSEVPNLLQNVAVYWERLEALFTELEPLETDIDFETVARDALQSELAILEKVYVRINLQVELDERHWSRPMWLAADELLDRMDTVLEALGFDEFHDDRILVAEMNAKNRAKYQKWLLSNRVLRRRA